MYTYYLLSYKIYNTLHTYSRFVQTLLKGYVIHHLASTAWPTPEGLSRHLELICQQAECGGKVAERFQCKDFVLLL